MVPGVRRGPCLDFVLPHHSRHHFCQIQSQVYGSVFGIIFVGGLLGGGTVPKVIGNPARGSTVQKIGIAEHSFGMTMRLSFRPKGEISSSKATFHVSS